jgi:outer membrane protein
MGSGSMIRLCLFLTALITSAAIAQEAAPKQDLRAATVDMQRVFVEFQKSRQTIDNVKAARQKFIEERAAKVEKLQSMGGELAKLQKQAGDPILSASAREKAKNAFESKAADYKKVQDAAREFEKTETEGMRDDELKVKEELMAQINTALKVVAKVGSYNLVLDRTGLGSGGVSVVLLTVDMPDLTDALLTELNKDAPPTEEVAKPAKK